MATNDVGSVGINLKAGGTATFTSDIDKAFAKAKASAREMAQAMRKEVQESKASLALMGEEFGVHLPRHVRTFVATLPGVSKAMSAAFTGLAIIAIADVLVKAAEKAYELAKALDLSGEAAKKNAQAWQSLHQDHKLENEQIELTNAKLEVEIAKLEHKPVNNLKVSLLEAQVAADQLAKSLQKDIDKQLELLKAQHGDPTIGKDIQAQLSELRSGNEGDTGLVAARQGNSLQSQKAILEGAVRRTQEALAAAQNPQPSSTVASADTPYVPGVAPRDQEAIATLKRQLADYNDLLQHTSDEIEHIGLEHRKNADIAKNANAGSTRNPFKDAITIAQAELANSQAMSKVEMLTTDEIAKQLALNKANLEITRIMDTIKEHNAQPGAHKIALPTDAEQNQLRTLKTQQAMKDADNERIRTLTKGSDAIALRIAQEKSLADAIEHGAMAVRQVNAAAQAAAELPADKNYTQAQRDARAQEILAEMNAKAHTTATQTIDDKEHELSAVQNLTAAYLKGADAVRQAELENQISAIKRKGLSSDDESSEIKSVTLQSQAQHQETIAKAAGQAANADKDHLKTLQETLLVLQNMPKTPEALAAIKQTSKEMMDLQSKMALQSNSPAAGMTVFFNQMVTNAHTAAQEVHDVLGKAFEDLNNDLSKILTGQKVNWESFFRGIAQQTAKSALQQGEKGIAKALGFGGKPDGSMGNPLNVRIIGGFGLGGADADAAPGAGGGFLKTLLGSLFHLPGYAAGGDPDPYGISVVGEHGPELFSPNGIAGHVYSNRDSQSLLGGGGGLTIGNIDARNSNPAEVDARVRQGIAAAHPYHVQASIAAQRELKARRPAGRGF